MRQASRVSCGYGLQALGQGGGVLRWAPPPWAERSTSAGKYPGAATYPGALAGCRLSQTAPASREDAGGADTTENCAGTGSAGCPNTAQVGLAIVVAACRNGPGCDICCRCASCEPTWLVDMRVAGVHGTDAGRDCSCAEGEPAAAVCEPIWSCASPGGGAAHACRRCGRLI